MLEWRAEDPFSPSVRLVVRFVSEGDPQVVGDESAQPDACASAQPDGSESKAPTTDAKVKLEDGGSNDGKLDPFISALLRGHEAGLKVPSFS